MKGQKSTTVAAPVDPTLLSDTQKYNSRITICCLHHYKVFDRELVQNSFADSLLPRLAMDEKETRDDGMNIDDPHSNQKRPLN
ncbi:hypothetical protein L1987_44516 [Smallanthus sonchifolius]|uniref:Uncharacterized protein n=1 Tax=Smallanthus sonchifolius TaxID=185202 RepID=A0ACB9GQF4_9ASTR|nr:hypothetical protein L1987_44516 [Smallanthus sonchifolius]